MLFRHLSNLREIWSYYYQDSRSFPLHTFPRRCFYAEKTPAYRNARPGMPGVSVLCLSPVHFRCFESRWVSCYAFFKWWRLLCLHPHCLRFKTPFVTLNIYFGTLTSVSLVRVSERYLTHRPPLLLYTENMFRVGKKSRSRSALQTLSVLYLALKHNEAILRHTSTGTSHRQIRLAFHP